jgi:hypothetical protein
MKIRWSSLFLGSFAPRFQIKLNTHGSNLNSIFLILSELKPKTSYLDCTGHIEGDIMQNHEQKKKGEKKVKNQDFMGKTNFFLSTLPFSPWVASTTWMHVGAPQKNTGKMSLIPIFNKNLPRAHTESEFDMLDIHGKLVKYVVHSSKRKN